MPHILVSLVGSGIAVAPCVLLVRPPRIQHGQEYPPSEHDAHANSHPKKPVGTASLFRRRFVGSVRTQKKTWQGDRCWGMLVESNHLHKEYPMNCPSCASTVTKER